MSIQSRQVVFSKFLWFSLKDHEFELCSEMTDSCNVGQVLHYIATDLPTMVQCWASDLHHCQCKLFLYLPQRVPPNEESAAITRDFLDSTVVHFVREVINEEVCQQISDLALEVVKDLQEISFCVVHGMKTVVTQVREMRNDRALKKYARNIMQDVLVTSKIVMNFVDDLDNIIKLLKRRYYTVRQ